MIKHFIKAYVFPNLFSIKNLLVTFMQWKTDNQTEIKM